MPAMNIINKYVIAKHRIFMISLFNYLDNNCAHCSCLTVKPCNVLKLGLSIMNQYIMLFSGALHRNINGRCQLVCRCMSHQHIPVSVRRQRYKSQTKMQHDM